MSIQKLLDYSAACALRLTLPTFFTGPNSSNDLKKLRFRSRSPCAARGPPTGSNSSILFFCFFPLCVLLFSWSLRKLDSRALPRSSPKTIQRARLLLNQRHFSPSPSPQHLQSSLVRTIVRE